MSEFKKGCLGILVALMILPVIFRLMSSNPSLFYIMLICILIIILKIE